MSKGNSAGVTVEICLKTSSPRVLRAFLLTLPLGLIRSIRTEVPVRMSKPRSSETPTTLTQCKPLS